jgi:inositol oxygenase
LCFDQQSPSLPEASALQQPFVDEFAAKEVSQFRDYTLSTEDEFKMRIFRTYEQMHDQQTVESVRSRTARWTQFNAFRADVLSTLDRLDELVDESDPDIDLPNSVHAYQTAEQLRKDHPDLPWLHLTGLIHDLGKVTFTLMTSHPVLN